MLRNAPLPELTNHDIVPILENNHFYLSRVRVNRKGPYYALKLYKQNSHALEAYSREKEMLSKLKNKYLVKKGSDKPFQQVITTPFLVTEFADNKDLLELIQKVKRISEDMARPLFKQLIKGLLYMHKEGYAHLDIKLENIFLNSKFKILIGDFDKSQSVEEPSLLGKGTSNYRAPEIIDGSITEYVQADVFSAGIVLFTLVMGRLPYSEEKENGKIMMPLYDLLQQNKEVFWEAHSKDTGVYPSKEFMALIEGMLHRNPYKRLKMKDIKNTQWYKKNGLSSQEVSKQLSRLVSK